MLVRVLTLLLVGASPALAGYGDLDQDGDPTWAARDLHLWTNAARVDPEAFEADYNAGGCSFDDFSGDEQTPKAPLYLDYDLNEAAEYHSADMEESGNFSHSSSDGTSFGERLARFYDESGYVGENIAYGYGDGYRTVFTGWMCSTDGHRANIMSGDYNELGTGVSGAYYTQDFAAGTAESEGAVAMAIHTPQSPTDEVSVYADWQDAEAPARLELILDGQPRALALAWGAEEQGIYGDVVALTADGSCHQYFVEWETEDGATGRFPEEGSYTFGAACEDELGWIPEQMCVTGRDCAGLEELARDIELIGCSTTGGAGRAAGYAPLLALLALLARGRAARSR